MTAGADKISINSAAVKNPDLIERLAKRFGSQCIVLAIDTKYSKDEWIVYIHGGRTPTNKRAVEWAKKAVNLGGPSSTLVA